MSKSRFHFTVSVPRVPGVPHARFQAYIQEAVQDWGGQFHPDDDSVDGDPLGPPCVLMDQGAVVVTAQRRHK